MPKSYCYIVSLCGYLWGWVMLVPVGWVLVIFLWFIQASVSIQPPNPLITLRTAALEKDRLLMFNPVT